MTTARSLASAQGLVVGLVLVVAGLAKLPAGALRDLVRSSALTALAGSAQRSRRAWRVVTLAELGVGVCVLSLPGWRWPLVAAAVLLSSGLVYIAVGHWARPGSPCGCFGRLSRAAPWWQSLLRTGLLLGCCVVALVTGGGWTTAGGGWGIWALVAVELIALVVVSPERQGLARAAGRWIRRSQWTIERWRIGEDCAKAEGPPSRETRWLPETALWGRVSDYVRADEASDVWRDGCWEFATFPGRYDGAQATVVFGIPLDPFIRTRTVAVVDEHEGSVLVREEMRSSER
ncbi:MAG TPA: MauE/DoxX family redox-associated membrane protein [Acidimicrobiales bacterium]